MITKKTYIIILNWNSWADTLECLESVFRSDYSDYQVIVCDNCSHDNSMEYIKMWADGSLNVNVSSRNPLKHLSSPPVKKPVSYVEYTRSVAESGGDSQALCAKLVLIPTGANLGFAGGCNVALRYILCRNDFAYAWLLNNDTVVQSTALKELVRKMERTPSSGMCGSTLYYYDSVNTIQVMGGVCYNKYLALPKPVTEPYDGSDNINEEHIENRIDYIAGASLFLTHGFLQSIGLMSEDYFLFFEEIDWAVRSKGLYTINYASKSIVFHKEGSSIGTSSVKGKNSPLSEYYFNKNRIKFTYKYYPMATSTVLIAIIISIFNRVRRKQPENVKMIIKALFGHKI